MKQTRLDALADGIFAIVMTLLVFEIRVPEFPVGIDSSTLWTSIVTLYPFFLSYLLSFSLLFTYWRSHHYIASVLAKNIDIRFTNLNALFFLFVGLVPFSSQLLGKYNTTETAIVFFASNVILIGLSLFAMRVYVLRSPNIENIVVTKRENQHAYVRILLPVIAAIIAIVVSFYNKQSALIFFTLAIFFNVSARSTTYFFMIVDLFKSKKQREQELQEYVK